MIFKVFSSRCTAVGTVSLLSVMAFSGCTGAGDKISSSAVTSPSSSMAVSSATSSQGVSSSAASSVMNPPIEPCSNCEGVIINEAVSSNIEFEDADGDSEDWLELYNNSDQAVSLAGWSLTDDPLEPQQWLLPDIQLAAGAYLLIWASDKGLAVAGEPLHTNFKVSSDGETLYLHDQTGALKHSLEVSGLRSGTSVGLSNTHQATVFYDAPTPGAVNSMQEYAGVITAELTFSAVGGPNSPAMVMIGGAQPGQEIRYTLDATIPTANSDLYQGAIMTPENIAIRARAFADTFIPSQDVSRTFLADATHDIPVITLITEPVNFFDNDYGIYVLGDDYERAAPNYGANFWEDWERPIHFALYETPGELAIEFNAGVKIFGGWSRSINTQKSLAFFSRTRYGTNKFKYPFFPELDYDKYNNFILRNSGNDWNNTMLRDLAMTSLMADTDVDYQAGRPTAVYLNCDYWGLHNLREKTNEHMLAKKHDIDKDDINLLELNAEVVEGSAEEYLALTAYLSEADPTTQAFYDSVAAQVDLSNFIAYYTAQIYIVNTDWPHNNIKFWNSPTTPWRWILYDTDFGFGQSFSGEVSTNTLEYATGNIAQTDNGGGFGGGGFGGGFGGVSNPPEWATLVPSKLLQNPTIQAQFINFFADQLNSRFLPAHVEAHITNLASQIATEIPAHKERWEADRWYWQTNIDDMILWGNQRPSYMWQHLTEFFELSTPTTLTIKNLNTQAGTVALNSLTINTENWSGEYFPEIPITLTAVAAEGFEFSHWSGAGDTTDAAITLNITEAITLTPVFVAAM